MQFSPHHGRAVVASDLRVALPVLRDAVRALPLLPRTPLVLDVVVVVVIDEVLLEDMNKVDKIHSVWFKGRIWVALASQGFYDFKSTGEEKPTSDLKSLPIVKNHIMNR